MFHQRSLCYKRHLERERKNTRAKTKYYRIYDIKKIKIESVNKVFLKK